MNKYLPKLSFPMTTLSKELPSLTTDAVATAKTAASTSPFMMNFEDQPTVTDFPSHITYLIYPTCIIYLRYRSCEVTVNCDCCYSSPVGQITSLPRSIHHLTV